MSSTGHRCWKVAVGLHRWLHIPPTWVCCTSQLPTPLCHQTLSKALKLQHCIVCQLGCHVSGYTDLISCSSLTVMSSCVCSCPARFLLGKRWNAGVLDVQFFGHCEHKIGVQAGRLAKSDRQLAVEEAQGALRHWHCCLSFFSVFGC